MTLRELFKLIADAIREKTGETGEILAKDFPEKIAAIEVGNGSCSGSGDGGPIITFVSDYPFTNGKTMFSVNTTNGKLTEIPELAEFEGFFDGFMDGGVTYASLKRASTISEISLDTVFDSDKILITKTAPGYYLIFTIDEGDVEVASFLNDEGQQVTTLTSELKKQGTTLNFSEMELPEIFLAEGYKIVGWKNEYNALYAPFKDIDYTYSFYSNVVLKPSIINLSDENIIHIILKADSLTHGFSYYNLESSNTAIKGYEGSIFGGVFEYWPDKVFGYDELHIYFDKTVTDITIGDLLGHPYLGYMGFEVTITNEETGELIESYYDAYTYINGSLFENGKTYIVSGYMNWY